MMIGSIATPTPGLTGLWVFALAVSMAGMVCVTGRAGETKVPVTFPAATKPTRRMARPVVLVAAALGVKPEVFRISSIKTLTTVGAGQGPGSGHRRPRDPDRPRSAEEVVRDRVEKASRTAARGTP